MEVNVPRIKQEADTERPETVWTSSEFDLSSVKIEAPELDECSLGRIMAKISIKQDQHSGDICQSSKNNHARGDGAFKQHNSRLPLTPGKYQRHFTPPRRVREVMNEIRRRPCSPSDIRSFFRPKKATDKCETDQTPKQVSDNASDDEASTSVSEDYVSSDFIENNDSLSPDREELKVSNDMVYIELVCHSPNNNKYVKTDGNLGILRPTSAYHQTNRRKRKRSIEDIDSNDICVGSMYTMDSSALQAAYTQSLNEYTEIGGDEIEKNTKVVSRTPRKRQRHQDNVASRVDRQDMTIISPTKRLKFKCSTCPASFDTLAKLNEHKRDHRKSKPYHCRLRGMRLCKKSNMLMHTEFHCKPSTKCEVCDTWISHDGRRRHMQIHSAEKPYKCEVCEKSFRRADTRYRHMAAVHKHQKYSCIHCPRSFSTKAYLEKHVIQKHALENGSSLEAKA